MKQKQRLIDTGEQMGDLPKRSLKEWVKLR